MNLKYYINDLAFVHCKKCSNELIKNLNAIPMIKKVHIDFTKETIEIETDNVATKSQIDEIVSLIKEESYCKKHRSNHKEQTSYKYIDKCGEMDEAELLKRIKEEDKIDDVKIDTLNKEISISYNSNISAYNVISKVVKNLDDDVILKVISLKIKKAPKLDKETMIKFSLIGLGVIFFILGIIFRYGIINETLSFILFILSYFSFSYDLFIDCFNEFKEKNIFNESLLMIIASLGSLMLKEEIEAIMLVVLFAIGEYLEDKAKDKSMKSIEDMINIKVNEVTLIDGKIIKIEEAKIGDELQIKPGELIPLDSIVLDGESNIDTKKMTGESMPQFVSKGSSIISGTLNLDGMLKAEVKKEIKDSASTKLLELVEEAKNKKSKAESFISKFSKIYTPVVILIGLIVLVVNYFILNNTIIESLNNCFVFLVVSCPCALVISVPLSFSSGIGRLSREGIMVKGSDYLESFNEVNTIVFDKTGTLTKGEFEVTNFKIFDNFSESEFIKIVSSIEAFSNHPIAKSIVKWGQNNLEKDAITDLKEEPGMGVSAIYKGSKYYVGKLSEELNKNVKFLNNEISGSTVYLVNSNKILGYIVLNDEIKEGAKDTVDYFNSNNIKMLVLTGDSEVNALRLKEKLNLTDIKANLLPDQKLKILEDYIKSNEKGKVAYVGDGINDAPSLEIADIGVAIGTSSSDAAKEASDIVISKEDLEEVKNLHKVSKKTHRISLFNIIFALIVKIIAMILVISNVLIDHSSILMFIGLIADVGVTLLCILNSSRILGMKLE